jgi:dTDP-4-dehydrorhamnose reductase
VKTILLTGKTGQVGHELVTALAPLGRVIAVGRDRLDLTQPDSIVRCVRDTVPDIIVNAAGYTSVDGAESEADLARQVNAIAPGILAEEAKRAGALLVHYSTDYVYDGSKEDIYLENDTPNPVNVYGHSKLEGERNIEASGCHYLIFRTSWLYADRGSNFLRTILKLAREEPELRVVSDQIGSPTWARVLAEATASALLAPDVSSKVGLYHLSAGGHTSRYDFANEIIRLAAEITGIRSGWAKISPCTTDEFPRPAARPLNVATSKKLFLLAFGATLTPWEQQLNNCLRTIRWEHVLT